MAQQTHYRQGSGPVTACSRRVAGAAIASTREAAIYASRPKVPKGHTSGDWAIVDCPQCLGYRWWYTGLAAQFATLVR